MELTCPECDTTGDAEYFLWSGEDSPQEGDDTFCPICGTMLRLIGTKLVAMTDDELEEARKDPAFVHREMMGGLLVAMLRAGVDLNRLAVDPDTAQVQIIDGDDLPPELREMIEAVVRRVEVDHAAEEYDRYVTAEVANHILWTYGDERASMPSLAVSGAISLIQTCMLTDDVMLHALNHVGMLHGYVLGLGTVRDRPDPEATAKGFLLLRRIAGLLKDGEQ